MEGGREGGREGRDNIITIAWSKYRETTGLMCDRNIPTKLKDSVYNTAMKPAMVYGAECWAVRHYGGEDVAHN